MTGRDAIDTFNGIEVVLWIALGLFIFFRAKQRNLKTWGWAISLILFGLSDVVELQTGAFWRPWWLLVWKAGCMGAFVCLWRFPGKSWPGDRRSTQPEQDGGA